MQNLTPGRPTGFHWQNSVLGRNDSMLTRQIQPDSLWWNHRASTSQTKWAPLKQLSLQILFRILTFPYNLFENSKKVIVFSGNIESLGAQEDDSSLDYRYSIIDLKVFLYTDETQLSYLSTNDTLLCLQHKMQIIWWPSKVRPQQTLLTINTARLWKK